MTVVRKLIEVSLPLETINRESAREKSVPRKGHPATMHLWWARRPLAAARAVLFAQLVDDPSSHPDRFPTEDAVTAERKRLHDLIEKLVVWENTQDENLFATAHKEILESTGGNPPAILDPFAGGGTIPLEAQRLGLEAHASDLNPVAVLISKALIEFPPKLRNATPVYPGLADSQIRAWKNAQGIAADVRAYGQWIRDEAHKRIGHLTPKATLSDGSQADVIAWIWTRTITCPNPQCRIRMPLVRSWWLGKKKGRESYVKPRIVNNAVQFDIGHGLASAPTPDADGTIGRTSALCIACGATVSRDYIKAEGLAGRMGAQLMATVAEGNRQRIYLAPTPEHESVAVVDRPDNVPDQELGYDPRNLWTPSYGLTRFSDLFTARQLIALTTFSDLIIETRERILEHALASGMVAGKPLAEGGTGAAAYADATVTYLSFAVSKLADWSSSACSWIASIEGVRDTFARQALPIVWDYVEINPFSSAVGNFVAHTTWVAEAIEGLPAGKPGWAVQRDAQRVDANGFVISTDPPYYDNIGYSDLSDFFYVWLRRSLRGIHPELFSTMVVPKAEELVANPYRHDGKNGARTFFEAGFKQVFANAREHASTKFPITVFYAFKQSEATLEGSASSGWETLLEGMVRSGWSITGTWPMRSERAGRMLSVGTNALASSIVLALRPRPDGAAIVDRRGFIAALQAELPGRLRELQHGAIAPVDLPQAAIGPGMAVFSRYAKVIESDGSAMSVRSALARINEVLDQVLSEQEGDFDGTTRFALTWYRQHGYKTSTFGSADNIARARNTSVNAMERAGILTSLANKVTLIAASDLPQNYDPVADLDISAWEVLHHVIRVLNADGVGAAGRFLGWVAKRADGGIDPGLVKELAFLLFSIADSNKWTKDAIAFNNVATSWSDITSLTRSGDDVPTEDPAFDYDDGEE